jgi:hypothetical protein
MRDALARHDFGVVFAVARKWAGISYSKIGEACGIKPERVGTLAKGIGSITSYDKIAHIADALSIPGDMVGLPPRVWEQTSRRTSLGVTAIVQRNGDETVLRRDFLKSSAIGAGAALGLPSLADIVGQRHVGAELAGTLRHRAARLRQLDNVLGGGDTYRIYAAEFEATQTVLKTASYTDSVGRDLLSVLAEQAQQAGWAAFDAGDHKRAALLYEASHAAAIEAGDAPLEGNALAFLAYQRLAHDPAAGVEMATASCEAAGPVVGSVGALLYERRAWAHAVAGNATEADRALDMARTALAIPPDGPEPDWSSWVDESELQIMSGRCWTELKRPLRAVPVLKDVLARFNDAYARDKALYLSWLADAYLTAGEPEESAAVTSHVLDLSIGVASVRPGQQISKVLSRLSEFSTIPQVASVLDRTRR